MLSSVASVDIAVPNHHFLTSTRAPRPHGTPQEQPAARSEAPTPPESLPKDRALARGVAAAWCVVVDVRLCLCPPRLLAKNRRNKIPCLVLLTASAPTRGKGALTVIWICAVVTFKGTSGFFSNTQRGELARNQRNKSPSLAVLTASAPTRGKGALAVIWVCVVVVFEVANVLFRTPRGTY